MHSSTAGKLRAQFCAAASLVERRSSSGPSFFTGRAPTWLPTSPARAGCSRPRRLDARGDFGAGRVDRTGLLRRTQRTRPRNGARHQHLVAALVMEVAIGEAHARDRAAEAAVVGLFEVETRLERNALDRGADVLAADLKRVAGQAEMLTGPEPENCTAPAAPRSSRMRPAPRVPSKQVKANTLPATNRRASSAFMLPGNGRRKRPHRRDSPQHNTRKHAQLRTNPSSGRCLISLPAAYHTNHGDIEAAWLVKSERR